MDVAGLSQILIGVNFCCLEFFDQNKSKMAASAEISLPLQKNNTPYIIG